MIRRCAVILAALLLTAAAPLTAATAAPLPPGPAGADNTGYRVEPTRLDCPNPITAGGTYNGCRWDTYLRITGDGVTIVDSYAAAGLEADLTEYLTVRWTTVQGGLSLSSTNQTDVLHVEIRGGDDLMHVTGDRGRPVTWTTLQYVWAHDPTPQCGAHSDGIQVRGADRLSILGSTIDLGPWSQVCGLDTDNAAVFLENANGGNSNINLRRSYVNGGGYVVRYQTVAGYLEFQGVTVGPDARYGIQYDPPIGHATLSKGCVAVNPDGSTSQLVFL